MQRVKRTSSLLLLSVLLCAALTMTAFAEEDGSVWISMSEASGKTTAQIVTDTTVTDGVVVVTYDSAALTYDGVEVTSAYVAMYAVNADTPGVVRISWVAPGEYEANADGATLIRVNFTGEAEADDVSLSGTESSANDADGEPVSIVAKVDTSKLEEAIAAAEELKASDYTAESWSDLEEALAEAKAVLADENATQEQVDAATAKLNAAIDALIAAAAATPTPTPTSGKTPGTGDDLSPALFLGVLAGSAAVLAGVLLYNYRRKRV